jgi:hypothetical protein
VSCCELLKCSGEKLTRTEEFVAAGDFLTDKFPTWQW